MDGYYEFDTSDKSQSWDLSNIYVKCLINRVYEFGDIFSEFLFKKGSLTEKMVKSTRLTEGKEIESVITLPEAIEYFDYSMFNFTVEELESCCGRYNVTEQILTIGYAINTNYLYRKEIMKEYDRTILHEMIHLHEAVLLSLPIYFHESVLYCLYADLVAKISNLNSIVDNCAHISISDDMINENGLHSLLFLLKSFDIDLRFNWDLGTTYGYDMEDKIKNLIN